MQGLAFFFFQAEGGIRDFHVTGVQTCALPISAAVRDPGVLGPELRVAVQPAEELLLAGVRETRSVAERLPVGEVEVVGPVLGEQIGRASSRERRERAARGVSGMSSTGAVTP